MTISLFITPAREFTIGEIAALIGAEPEPGAPADRVISNIATLDRAGPNDLVFFDETCDVDQLRVTHAAACLIAPGLGGTVPRQVTALRVGSPFIAFGEVARALFPESVRPSSLFEAKDLAAGAFVHPTARLESGVTVDPCAVIGPRAEVGAGTSVGPTAVIGPGVRIGRESMIGAGATIVHALLGDRVIVRAGARIGQDGIGYRHDTVSYRKIPQVGRVIIQDDAEIGAGSAIDRGAIGDTVVGEGTKIDSLVQIGQNVMIGRHCLIGPQSSIAGGVTLEDRVTLEAQGRITDRVTVGERATIGVSSRLMHNVPAGETWDGAPARPA
jgi:UDP-3-O-[3-hydroxymyristoyl] glucosamine N-acyltransferase